MATHDEMKETQMDDRMRPGLGGVGTGRPARLHEAPTPTPPAQPKTIVDMFSKSEDPEVLEARRREARARAQRHEWLSFGVIALVVWLILIAVAVLPPLVFHLWKTF
jgi:nitrate reductase NapE component